MPKATPTQRNIVSVKRHYARVVAFAVFGISVFTFIVLQLPGLFEVEVDQNFADKGSVASSTETIDAYTLPESRPARIIIPKLYIDAAFEDPIGVNEDRTIQVPKSFDKVAWYKYGPTPGELGPSVILGHVDSYLGPAVFFAIGQLEPGDLIEIEREDGTTATFSVTALQRHEQSSFPTDLVYGNLDHAGLRLITCSGIYDHGTLRYSHNLIVFADLVEPEASSTEAVTL